MRTYPLLFVLALFCVSPALYGLSAAQRGGRVQAALQARAIARQSAQVKRRQQAAQQRLRQAAATKKRAIAEQRAASQRTAQIRQRKAAAQRERAARDARKLAKKKPRSVPTPGRRAQVRQGSVRSSNRERLANDRPGWDRERARERFEDWKNNAGDKLKERAHELAENPPQTYEWEDDVSGWFLEVGSGNNDYQGNPYDPGDESDTKSVSGDTSTDTSVFGETQPEASTDRGIEVTRPAIGSIVPKLPKRAIPVQVSRAKYFYYQGVFYRSHGEDGSAFEVVAAPVGAIVPNAPADAVKTREAGTLFLLAGGVSYRPICANGDFAYMVDQLP